MRFRCYSRWQDLPPGYQGLFARAGAEDFCLGRAWFEALAATVLEQDERLCIAAVEADALAGAPRVCLVGRHREHDPAFLGARSFSSLSNYYTLRMRRSSTAAIAAQRSRHSSRGCAPGGLATRCCTSSRLPRTRGCRMI